MSQTPVKSDTPTATSTTPVIIDERTCPGAPIKKSKKTKKKKQTYAQMMASITSPDPVTKNVDFTDESELTDEQKRRVGLGGGQFSKMKYKL